MTGERILYIVLIAVAIGIGIYGSMNNLFRPHVYYVCQYDAPPSVVDSLDFYLNERENYVVIEGTRKYKYDSATEFSKKYVNEDQTRYLVHNRIRDTWKIVIGNNTSLDYIDCKVTRQFLQRN